MYIVEKLQTYQFECQYYTENLQTILIMFIFNFSGKTILKLYLDLRAITVDGKGSLSNNFSVIFPNFVHLLATKPMAKQSRTSGQLSGGHWVEYRAEF